MSNSDYFSNHQRARKFPWTLYHAPLERDLQQFLQVVASENPSGHVLIVGCGLLHEIDTAPAGLQFSVADIDARAVDAVMSRNDPRIIAGYVVSPEIPIDVSLSQLGFDGKFAAIYAKEVVEHVNAWPLWLVGLRRALSNSGRLWLSTPNYGEPWLPLIESTALELVARMDGFSRRDIHPTRFSAAMLAQALRAAQFRNVLTKCPAPRFALTAWAQV
jgi:2-polyprenyl-3-methyl-5-hydroxy-6-metoxy-1,4-benzoquinol methylase